MLYLFASHRHRIIKGEPRARFRCPGINPVDKLGWDQFDLNFTPASVCIEIQVLSLEDQRLAGVKLRSKPVATSMT